MGLAPSLLADIGGTNARFTLVSGTAMEPITCLPVDEHPDVDSALHAFLGSVAGNDPPRSAAFACAGPVVGERVELTNSDWRVDCGELKDTFGFDDVILINDFAAVAWALPNLKAPDLLPVGGGRAVAGNPSVVIGPGTGLGVAAYIPTQAGGHVVVGEGGHVTMPAADDRETDVICRLRRHFGHVSAERLLSGDGLVHLYEANAAIDGTAAPVRTAPSITEAGMAGDCLSSRAALDMFCAMLGTVAGDAALSFGALGGVYIAGGIAPKIAEYFAESAFRGRFEAKGRFHDYLARIPTWIVTHPEPAFLGLAHVLSRNRRGSP